MKQARQPQAVADYIHKMGIKSYIDPVYSLCLGTPDFSLFELVGAYGTFANRGVFTDPIFVTRIEDRNGNVLADVRSGSAGCDQRTDRFHDARYDEECRYVRNRGTLALDVRFQSRYGR